MTINVNNQNFHLNFKPFAETVKSISKDAVQVTKTGVVATAHVAAASALITADVSAKVTDFTANHLVAATKKLDAFSARLAERMIARNKARA